jgi:hypothetical protein
MIAILIEIILACIIWIAAVQAIVALMLPISLICIFCAFFGGNTDVAIRDVERISAQKVAREQREWVGELG